MLSFAFLACFGRLSNRRAHRLHAWTFTRRLGAEASREELGSTLASGDLWLILFVFFGTYFMISACVEERLMLRQFTEEYRDYRGWRQVALSSIWVWLPNSSSFPCVHFVLHRFQPIPGRCRARSMCGRFFPPTRRLTLAKERLVRCFSFGINRTRHGPLNAKLSPPFKSTSRLSSSLISPKPEVPQGSSRKKAGLRT